MSKNKTPTIKMKENTMKLKANEVFEKIYIDICGPLKETWRKKKYILAIIDQYSRYISLTAISKQDEETITRTVLEKWILRFGAPKEIHVDQGKVFESKRFQDFGKENNIELHFSSPYHHNTNGVIERQFRTIKDCLNSTLQCRDKSDWETLIPEIEFVLNATEQKTLERSPAEIIFGRKIFRESWKKQQRTNAITQNSDTETKRKFEEDEQVLVKIENRTKDKERYEGPYKILNKIHERRYQL